MKRALIAVASILLPIGAHPIGMTGVVSPTMVQASLTPIVDWSGEAQRAIVPPPAGVGDKSPGDAAVYTGIVHAAMYDVAVAIHGGYSPYATVLKVSGEISPAAAIAAAAHGVLVGLLPTQVTDLNSRYGEYLSKLPNNAAKTNGAALGEQIAAAMLAMRANDGRSAEVQQVHALQHLGLGLSGAGRFDGSDVLLDEARQTAQKIARAVSDDTLRTVFLASVATKAPPVIPV